MTNETPTTGKTIISDGVVAKIAGIAAREVPGVNALGNGTVRAIGAIREAIGGTDLAQGVGVTVGESEVQVAISLVAEYPMPLQKIAEDVRAAVITAIESLVGLHVTEVNVTINDVHLPTDDEARGE